VFHLQKPVMSGAGSIKAEPHLCVDVSIKDEVASNEEVVVATSPNTSDNSGYVGEGGEDGEQQIYIIQTEEDEDVPVEGEEVVVAGGDHQAVSVIETVSALEQLSRGSHHVVTSGGDLLQVYEEVVLPDGTSAKLEDNDGSASVGNLTLPTAPLPASSLSSSLAAAVSANSGSSSRQTDPLTGQEFHICRICNQFVTADMLPTHNAQVHGNIRELTCMDCGKLFKSKRSLFGHRKEKHSGMLEVHSCPECGKSFGRKSNLKAHRESLHYGKKFPCIYCERIFTNRSSMNQHIKKTHSTTGFPKDHSAAAAVAAVAAANASVGPEANMWHPQTTVINI